MKKLILMNNSKLQFFYIFIFFIINSLIGFISLDYFSGEQYGYWYFNKIFTNEYLYPDISRSPVYVIYLTLFNWLGTPYNYLTESIITNLILCISLFYLFRKKYNNFYIFLIIVLSIGFFFNLIPYPQALALSFLNFALILRTKKNFISDILAYLLIILAIYCRITYIIVFILFISFDLIRCFVYIKKNRIIKYHDFLSIFLALLLFYLSYSFFSEKTSPSKFNNGYFQSLNWKPSKSKSNIDIAFQVNFNYLYYEKYKDQIDKDERDFYFTNKKAFNNSETLIDSIKSNPRFVFWGIIKNSTHIAPIILNKFNLRNFFPSCKNIGHSCYSNYIFISIVFIIFFLFNYYFFFKENFENNFDIKSYAIVNYILIASTVLAMPKIRYMAPFIFFLIPFNIYLIKSMTRVFKNRNFIKILSILIIFSFSFFNYTIEYLNKYLAINNLNEKKFFLDEYSYNLSLMKSELKNCNNILVSSPTFVLSNSNLNELNIFNLGDLPPYGNYKSENNLYINNNLEINCILVDNSMLISSGANRGTCTDFEIRRKNYLNPFIEFNKKNLKKIIDFGHIGKLHIYKAIL